MTFQAWLDRAIELRGSAQRSEVVFYLHLVDGEKQKDIWAGSYLTFVELINETSLTSPARYSKFAAALPLVGPDRALAIGIDGVIETARASTPERREEIARSLEQWTKDHGGVHASQQTVRTQVQQIDPRRTEPNTLKRALRAPQLEDENAALRRENAALKKEILDLRAKLAKLGGKKTKAEGPRVS